MRAPERGLALTDAIAGGGLTSFKLSVGAVAVGLALGCSGTALDVEPYTQGAFVPQAQPPSNQPAHQTGSGQGTGADAPNNPAAQQAPTETISTPSAAPAEAYPASSPETPQPTDPASQPPFSSETMAPGQVVAPPPAEATASVQEPPPLASPEPAELIEPPSTQEPASPLPPSVSPEGVAPSAASPSAFVAQGHLGRTMLSCDGGQTWVANRSDDDTARCQSDFDCTHHGSAAKGLAFGGGYVFGTFGWGARGSVRRSANGIEWETLHSQATPQLDAHELVGGIAYLNGALILARGSYADHFVSMDQGETWQASKTPNNQRLQTVIRRVGFSNFGDGRLIVIGDSNDEFFLSLDQGRTFETPRTLPADCGANVNAEGGFASNEHRMVVVGRNGNACASTDGGQTWVAGDVGQAVVSALIWNGERFVVYGRGTQHYTEDGITWNSRATRGFEHGLSAVAYGKGAYVATAHYADYEDQRMLYSEDGINWEQSSSYPKSHMIEHIAFGPLQASTVCPAP